MANIENNYPNLTWMQFAVCNDDATGAFEDMTRRLFSVEYLGEGRIPHSDHNNPGVEVLPILEPPHTDGTKQRKISFQAKYFENNISYAQIKKSMNQAIKYYGKDLDLIYLFCNKTLTTTAKEYISIKQLLQKSGIELYPISNKEILDMVSKHKDIANYFFLPRRRPDDILISQIQTGIVVNIEDESLRTSESTGSNGQIFDTGLLQSFAQEKINECKTLVLEMRFENSELNLIRYLHMILLQLRAMKYYCFIDLFWIYMMVRNLIFPKMN